MVVKMADPKTVRWPGVAAFLVIAILVVTAACGSDEGPIRTADGQLDSASQEYIDVVESEYSKFSGEITRCAELKDQACQTLAVQQLRNALEADPPETARWMNDAHERLRTAIGRMLIINRQAEGLDPADPFLTSIVVEIAASVVEIQAAHDEFVFEANR